MTNTENDIVPSFHFKVLFTGLKGITETDTRFESVTGIGGCRLYEPADAVKKIDAKKGATQFQPLVLRRAALNPASSLFLQWVLQCLNTRVYPALPEVLVQVLNESHKPLLSVKLTEVTLKSWALSPLDARASALLMEEFLLDYKTIEVKAG